MIKKIKAIINEIRDNQRQLIYGQNQLWASQKLDKLLPSENFLPQTTWSISPSAVLHALNILELKKRKSIIEFGSGITTIYIAQYLKLRNENSVFLSVESDLDWKIAIEKDLEKFGLSQYVKIVHCPIVEVANELAYKNQSHWYNTEVLKSAIDGLLFDFVLVDGPYGGATPYARYSAYPFLEPYTKKDIVWMLDDSRRLHESEIIRKWKDLSGLKLSGFSRYSILENFESYDMTPYQMN